MKNDTTFVRMRSGDHLRGQECFGGCMEEAESGS